MCVYIYICTHSDFIYIYKKKIKVYILLDVCIYVLHSKYEYGNPHLVVKICSDGVVVAALPCLHEDT